MIRKNSSIAYDNKGETLVEVMVAFIVLITVLALFTGAVTFASSSVTQSINKRRTTDDGYTALLQKIAGEPTPGAACDPSTVSDDYSIAIEQNRTGHEIVLNAYQYTENGTVYWVYR